MGQPKKKSGSIRSNKIAEGGEKTEPEEIKEVVIFYLSEWRNQGDVGL